MKKKPLVILAGPTAVGKTALSIRLAQAVDGEIVSADSMQVYRQMDIGSAKASPEEQALVPHHLLDCCEPDQAFDVVAYQKLALQAIADIHARGRIPVLTGGTGFYIQSVLRNIDFTECGEDRTYREELSRLAETEGAEALHARLRQADPRAAQEIHPHNLKRVIRALEYYHLTGEQISEHNRREQQKASAWQEAFYVLTCPRPLLYERIDRRVDQMIAGGLEDEVLALRSRGLTADLVSMQGLGYRQLMDCFDGRISRGEAIERIKAETRHYAKRQLTWFKREKSAVWLDKSQFASEDELLGFLLADLKSRGITENRR